ncbi:septum formation initiator family protein [Paenibacillus woosongensis]|uniref:Septum formation initiator family protein n=1 Tax=Paenibacillus woosongensis TaxID=307580 RepID=A0AA95I7Z7_9BACL|nr:septum formation initiator family protein [Paenibacillus woosongensis]WHX49183.1 septum formation initiator family protein [Paenibacillus woosongensis]
MRRTAMSTNSKNQSKGQATHQMAGARRRLRIWMGFMIIFLGWAAYTFFSQSSEINAKSQQLEERQASMNAATQSLEQLKYEISRLQDPEYIGQIAMKKYGLYKPGEIPVRVSESSPEND